MHLLRPCFLAVVFLIACDSSKIVTINLTNNSTDPDATETLYQNQNGRIIEFNACDGTPSVGNGEFCAPVSSDSVQFEIVTAADQEGLPDTMVLDGFEPGFYSAHMMFFQTDADSCTESSAYGVFEVKENEKASITLQLDIPHNCAFTLLEDEGDEEGITCYPGETDCGDSCANFEIDFNNCGGCDIQCAVGEECVAGICT